MIKGTLLMFQLVSMYGLYVCLHSPKHFLLILKMCTGSVQIVCRLTFLKHQCTFMSKIVFTLPAEVNGYI